MMHLTQHQAQQQVHHQHQAQQQVLQWQQQHPKPGLTPSTSAQPAHHPAQPIVIIQQHAPQVPAPGGPGGTTAGHPNMPDTSTRAEHGYDSGAFMTPQFGMVRMDGRWGRRSGGCDSCAVS